MRSKTLLIILAVFAIVIIGTTPIIFVANHQTSSIPAQNQIVNPPPSSALKTISQTLERIPPAAVGGQSVKIELTMDIPSDSTTRLLGNTNNPPFTQLYVEGKEYSLIFTAESDGGKGGLKVAASKTLINNNLQQRDQRIDRITQAGTDVGVSNWQYVSDYLTLYATGNAECGSDFPQPYCGANGLVDYYLGITCNTNGPDSVQICDQIVKDIKVNTILTPAT